MRKVRIATLMPALLFLLAASGCASGSRKAPSPVPSPPATSPGPVIPAGPAEVEAPAPPTGPEKAPILRDASWDEVDLPADGAVFDGLLAAARRSLGYYQKLPDTATLPLGDGTVSAADLRASVEVLVAILEEPGPGPRERLEKIKRRFRLVKSLGTDGAGRVLFTAYYEPVFDARTSREPGFEAPLYARPQDLITVDLSQFPLARSAAVLSGRLEGGRLVPYFTREDIDGRGRLSGKGLEVLWLSDPAEVFFLQIEGSGIARLGDGKTVHVLYAGKNGWPYVSLGRAMIDQGLLAEGQASMQSIKAYLAAHPERRDALLFLNPSYTFFRLADDGPFGNIGVTLAPGRSIATDASLFPKGAPALVKTTRPVVKGDTVTGFEPFVRLVMNQDTGGAIRGPGRVDLFLGAGDEAEAVAGRLRAEGELYFLLLK